MTKYIIGEEYPAGRIISRGSTKNGKGWKYVIKCLTCGKERKVSPHNVCPCQRPAKECKWTGCSEESGRSIKGWALGYCKFHKKQNDLRCSRGLTYEEFDNLKDQPPVEYLSNNGYVMVQLATKTVAKHTLVMESILNRSLVPGESVHHKNGKRDDNRPENLELWVGPIRYGQRAVDVCCPKCNVSYWDSTMEEHETRNALVE